MNIKNREQFEFALAIIRENHDYVIDTETNTLHARQQEKMPLVSIQIHVPFAKGDIKTFNFSFRHGSGYFTLNDGSYAMADHVSSIKNLTGRDKRTVILADIYYNWLFEQDNSQVMGNLPIEWMDELKEVLTSDKKYLFHNANFDLTVLQREGFHPMPNTEDTMIAVQFVWGDWGGKRNSDDKGIRVEMPERYYDRNLADLQGKEWGNRRLKWQARFWDLDDADAGTKDLREQFDNLTYQLADYAVTCAENDPSLVARWFSSKVYASWTKDAYSLDRDGITWHERQVKDIISRISSNDKEIKGRMWMMTSDMMVKYGELDVILTWGLYEKCIFLIDAWGVRDTYDQATEINMGLAWRMENMGVLLDVDEAQRRIDKNYAEAKAIMDWYDWNIDSWQAFKKKVGNFLSLPDTKADTVRKALEWIDDNKDYHHNGDFINGRFARRVINDRLAYKKLLKNTSTYLGKWVKAADPENRGHFYTDTTGTKTGRGTSGGDMGNGQNIPDRKSDVKEVIIAPENQLIFAIDYSNLELRIASWEAEVIHGFGNMEMTTVINREDAHMFTAKMLDVKGVMYPDMSYREIANYEGLTYDDDISNEGLEKLVWKAILRQAGKTGNFNLIYGGSHWSLGIQMGEDFGVTDEELEAQTEDDLVMYLSKNQYYYLNHRDTPQEDVEDIKRRAVVGKRFAPYQELYNRWHKLFPAFQEASEHFKEEAETLRPTPSGVGSFQYTVTKMPFYRSDNGSAEDFYNGRIIKHHMYDEKRWVKNKHGKGGKNQNIREYSCKKAWNNKVQGTAGQICFHSGWRFYEEFESDGVDIFVNIHDALDGYADLAKLEQVAVLMEVMADWNVEPKLDVELEASLDNWQNMREVKDVALWVQTSGQEGYDD